jgi:hypothetical protein
MPMISKTIDLDMSSKAVPISQLSKDPGLNLHWSEDSKKVYWTLGDEYIFTLVEMIKNGEMVR